MSGIIYRIQDKDGRGPYKPGFSKTWIEGREDHDNLGPGYIEFRRVDLLAHYGEHIGCGCRTLEQLRRWFTPLEHKRLQKHGYRAVKMKIDRMLAESDVQCVFARNKPLKEDFEEVQIYDVSSQEGR